jgi:hypothetical protein
MGLASLFRTIWKMRNLASFRCRNPCDPKLLTLFLLFATKPHTGLGAKLMQLVESDKVVHGWNVALCVALRELLKNGLAFCLICISELVWIWFSQCL